MPGTGEHRLLNVLGRIAAWFLSLLLAALLFSFFFSLSLGDARETFTLFRIVMTIAFPVACFYLPIVIRFKNAGGQHVGIILLSGIFIGPLSICLWAVVEGWWRGRSAQMIWFGDPLAGGLLGIPAFMVFALIVGSLTTSSYLIALKMLNKSTLSHLSDDNNHVARVQKP